MLGKIKGGIAMKTISIFLALINSLLAGLLITFLISSVDFHVSATLWSAMRILVALSVIAIGLLTWINAIGSIHPGLLAISSLFLVAVGAATVVWTFQRALVTGDMEYYMILYGGSLFAQGFSLLFGMSQQGGAASAA
jgi:uncharacterized membrane protein YidH (DUF202 family)